MNKDIEDHKIAGLRELYQLTPAARAVFDWAASRTNDAAETNLDRIMQKTQVSRSEAVDMARRLDDLGCGVFVVGRKGAKSRIRWNYSLKSMGQAAQGHTDSLDELDSDVAEDVVDQQLISTTEPSIGDVTLTIPEAKRQLALAFGVTPEAIEITIRG
jgi:NAD-dependent DNA ligase